MNSFSDLASRLSHIANAEGDTAYLEAVGSKIERDAKEIIGHYQHSDTGPFPEWEELAPSSKADRVSKGFTPNDPLLRTGALRDSINHEVRGRSVAVGSDLDIAIYQEMGTATIPPRPFLRIAAFRSKKWLGQLYAKTLRDRLHGRHL